MAAATMMIPALGMLYGASQARKQPETDYGEIPGRFGANVTEAGASAARRQTNTGPQGTLWSARNWMTRLPMLMGK